jgi:nicotinate-nucleotide pyrophosphorylase (carboxylating)
MQMYGMTLQDREAQHHIVMHIMQGLVEDRADADYTSMGTLSPNHWVHFALRTRQPAVVCGLACLPPSLLAQDPTATLTVHATEGSWSAAGDTLLTGHAPAHTVLAWERTALNVLQALCGVSTQTAWYVRAVQGTGVRILDTRKMLPGWRIAYKYAVRMGGGHNHRYDLHDGLFVKDNHIALAGGLTPAVAALRTQMLAGHIPDIPLVVEVDTLEQLAEALQLNVPWILLDNMDINTLQEAVAYTKGRATLEASGGVRKETVRAIAATGIDAISIGALTHSVQAIDIGLDVLGCA